MSPLINTVETSQSRDIMKAKFLLGALVTTALLAFNLNAAADGGDEQDSESEHECDINGHEVMDAVIALTPTTNAPAGAHGVAKIESENDDTNETATVELKLVGLDPGDYVLSVTQQSDGTNVILGQITIPIRNEDDDEDGGFGGEHRDSFSGWDFWIHCNWGGFTNWGSWTNWSITNWCNISNRVTVTVTEAEVDLPAGLNPTDIGQIILSDTNGKPILVGDLVKPATNSVINISATVRLSPGGAAPSAAGTAQLQSTASKGKWTHQFNLTATGMGTNSNFRVNLNGKKIGATRSNKAGQLAIKKLPSRVPAVRSLLLLDAKGNEAAHAQF
jgi:hypothetical protein